MLREISVFTGTADVELALGLLQATASGRPRNDRIRQPLAELAEYFGSEVGYARLLAVASEMGIPSASLPSLEYTRTLFDDELLSARALRMHRGRNVYSAGKANLWKHWWLPFRDQLVIDATTLALIEQLVAQPTHEGGVGGEDCVRLLTTHLRDMDFWVQEVREPGHAPLLVARRPAINMTGAMVLYGHYDVETPVIEEWDTDPWTVTERNGRLYGAGIGDNKAALAHRLVSIARLSRTPALTWIIQGEEEIGSPLAHRVLPGLLSDIRPTIWVEENGYFDNDGTQRILSHVVGAHTQRTRSPDRALTALIEQLGVEARRHGVGHRTEYRALNKNFFPGGCPFGSAIPTGERYLAIGVNDPRSGIHSANESVPMWTFPIHARQIERLTSWCDVVGTTEARSCVS